METLWERRLEDPRGKEQMKMQNIEIKLQLAQTAFMDI